MDHLSINEWIVLCSKIDSKCELISSLQNKFNTHLLLTEPESYSNSTLLSCCSQKSNHLIGIGCLHTDAKPGIYGLPKANSILIGYNDRLAKYDLEQKALCYDISLGSPFYSFGCCCERIVVFSELSVLVLSLDGIVQKIFPLDDVLTKYQINGNTIICNTETSQVIYRV